VEPASDTTGIIDAPAPAPPAATAPAALTSRSGPPSILARNLVIGPLILMVIAGYVGDTFFLAYHDKHPLIFIAMNARSRNLVLASEYLDPVSYYVVGALRLLLSDPFFFLLGIWYGDAAVSWMERKSPTYGGMLRSAERWFGKAAYPLIAIAPNNYICLFAGAAGISVPAFLVLNIGGTLVRLWLLRWSSDIFANPLHSVSRFITDHRLPVLAISVALVGLTIWSERRRGGSEISELAHLDDEISRASGDADEGGL
jgi:membrane protein DedA with SNARE-associated domain